MGEALLDIRGLKTYFKTDDGMVRAVDGVDLTIGRGETVSVVGESGSGKTVTAMTVLKLIAMPPGRIVAGSILWKGRDLVPLGAAAMRHIRSREIAIVFQEPMTSLNPVYTVGDQLEECYLRHRRAGRAEARERAEELLARVDVAAPRLRLLQYPHQLSGGLRQRMVIAMALMCQPALLIADEPTTALDVTVQAETLRLFADLQREFNLAILLISHDLGVVARIGHHVAVMYGGRIVERGPVAEVFGAPQHPYTRGLLDCLPVSGMARREDRLGAIPGRVPSLIGRQEGCNFRNRCAEVMPDCASGDILMRALGGDRGYRCLLPAAAAGRQSRVPSPHKAALA